MKQVEKILTHKRDIKARVKSIDGWKVKEEDKKDLLRFLEDYRSGEITGRVGTNIDTSIERIIQYLKPAFEFVSKKVRVGSLKKKDLEVVKKFKENLLKDKIKNHYKKPYGIRTKKMMLYTFGKYLRWKLEPEIYITFSKTLLVILESKESEPDSFNLEQLDKLYKACSTDSQRFLIIVLFSSGARAEEFHNIRYEDVTLPDPKETFVKVRIRHGFSKTKGRTITLYHKRALEVVRDYMELRKQEGCEPDEPILKMSYDTGRKWLKRLGERVLNINLYYHLFRASCATWIASKSGVNRQQLCIFFGWRFNSPMPDIYISRKGLDMKDVDEKFEKTENEDLKSQLDDVLSNLARYQVFTEKILESQLLLFESKDDLADASKALLIEAGKWEKKN